MPLPAATYFGGSLNQGIQGSPINGVLIQYVDDILIASKIKEASDQNIILTFWQTRVIKSKGKVQISQPTVKCLGCDLPKGQRQI